MREKLKIYTDGSVITNPGKGGWSFIILKNGHELLSDSSGFRYTTNNRMEILAVLNAIYALNGDYTEHDIFIYSDSQYTVRGCNHWAENWVKRNERKMNMDLWVQIVDLKKKYNITCQWIRSHNGNHYNEICDEMANAAAHNHPHIADIIYEKKTYHI